MLNGETLSSDFVMCELFLKVSVIRTEYGNRYVPERISIMKSGLRWTLPSKSKRLLIWYRL